MHCLKVSFLALALFGAAQSYSAGIQIVNADGAGEGFNDTTAVSAIGGNTATTLGAQRLAVFNRAAELFDHADIFVADNHGGGNGFLRPFIPFIDVNISAADGAFFDLH